MITDVIADMIQRGEYDKCMLSLDENYVIIAPAKDLEFCSTAIQYETGKPNKITDVSKLKREAAKIARELDEDPRFVRVSSIRRHKKYRYEIIK